MSEATPTEPRPLAAEARDRVRFEEEALELSDQVYRVARRLVGSREEAEDLVQETYARAFRSWRSYTPGTNLRAWLLRILTNLNIDRGRRKQRAPEMQPLEEGDYYLYNRLEESSREPASDQDAVVERLSQDDVVSALSAVPHDFRDVVVLVDIGDFTYQDAAQILDIPIGTVMSRLHRGRRILKQRARREGGRRSDVRHDPCEKCEELMQPYLDRGSTTPSGPRPRRISTAAGTAASATASRRACAVRARGLRRGDGARAEAEARGAPDAALAKRSGRQVLRTVDVPRRAEVVARDEHGVERARALVGDVGPDRAAEHDRVAALAAVRRRDDVAPPPRQARSGGRPRRGRARARRRGRPPLRRPVAERGEAAAQRRARPALPVGALDGRASVSTSCAPATTTISSSSRLARSPFEHPASSSRCFGEPNLVAAPAARTTAATAAGNAAEPRHLVHVRRARHRS